MQCGKRWTGAREKAKVNLIRPAVSKKLVYFTCGKEQIRFTPNKCF